MLRRIFSYSGKYKKYLVFPAEKCYQASVSMQSRDIKKDDLRRSLGMVIQDTHLFTGTIADNIRYGKLDATDEEVIRAAELANADSFIRRLPDGYNTMLHSRRY